MGEGSGEWGGGERREGREVEVMEENGKGGEWRLRVGRKEGGGKVRRGRRSKGKFTISYPIPSLTGCFIKSLRCLPQVLLKLNVSILHQHNKYTQNFNLGVDIVGSDKLVEEVLLQEHPGLVRLVAHF